MRCLSGPSPSVAMSMLPIKPSSRDIARLIGESFKKTHDAHKYWWFRCWRKAHTIYVFDRFRSHFPLHDRVRALCVCRMLLRQLNMGWVNKFGNLDPIAAGWRISPRIIWVHGHAASQWQRSAPTGTTLYICMTHSKFQWICFIYLINWRWKASAPAPRIHIYSARLG